MDPSIVTKTMIWGYLRYMILSYTEAVDHNTADDVNPA